MDIRRTSRVGGIAGAVLLLMLFPGADARAQFAPVNKARELEKSVIEGDDEVRKIRSGAAEIKSAKPAVVKPTAAKSAASKPKIVKSLERNRAVLEKVTPKQTPPKAAPKKSAAKPAAKSPAPKPVAVTPKQTTPARSSLIAAPRPVPKKRRQRIRYVKPTPIIVIEAINHRSVISGISEDGRFVYLRVTPEATFRVGNQVVPATSIVEGMKLDCWGAWDKFDTDVYAAKGVVVRGRLDDYALRLKINEACQRLSRPRSAVAAAPLQPAAVTDAPAKPEEKKPYEKKPVEPGTGEPKPGEPATGEPKPEEPKPADPNAPPANPEPPPPAEPGNP